MCHLNSKRIYPTLLVGIRFGMVRNEPTEDLGIYFGTFQQAFFDLVSASNSPVKW